MHRDNPRVTKGASPPFSSLLEDRPFVLINEEAFEKRPFFCAFEMAWDVPGAKKNNNLCFVVLIEKSKNTTLSGGSLGSRVDEERSQLRDLV